MTLSNGRIPFTCTDRTSAVQSGSYEILCNIPEYKRIKAFIGSGFYDMHWNLEFTYSDTATSTITQRDWIVTVSASTGRGDLFSFRAYDRMSSYALEREIKGIRILTGEWDYDFVHQLILAIAQGSIV